MFVGCDSVGSPESAAFLDSVGLLDSPGWGTVGCVSAGISSSVGERPCGCVSVGSSDSLGAGPDGYG